MRQKRNLFFILIVSIVTIILTACVCVEPNVNAISHNQFVMIESYGDFYTVYHEDTKVMYAVSNGTYNGGNVTLLVDAEGKPLLHED